MAVGPSYVYARGPTRASGFAAASSLPWRRQNLHVGWVPARVRPGCRAASEMRMASWKTSIAVGWVWLGPGLSREAGDSPQPFLRGLPEELFLGRGKRTARSWTPLVQVLGWWHLARAGWVKLGECHRHGLQW